MSDDGAGQVTQLLQAWRRGEESALEELSSLIYGELRRLARVHLNRERADHTLGTRDLVHEAFLRLLGQRQVEWHNRAHFFAIASRMMRRILVDHARRRSLSRHGGGVQIVRLTDVDVPASRNDDLEAIARALDALAEADPLLARMVEMRFFGGLSHTEIAEVLGLSNPTVRRRWRMAKAWLYQRLQESGGTDV